MSGLRGRWAVARPALAAAVLCAVLLAAPVVGTDLAAQEFRTWLLRTHGPLLWNGLWYGGHLLPGYSVLFPPLAAAVGTRLLGAVACVVAAAAGAALAGTADRTARAAGWWLALGAVGTFVQGQLPFLLGLAAALVAGLLARADRPRPAGAAALAASLASPLAGAFLLTAALAWWPDAGRRRAGPLSAAGAGVAVGALLGDGGVFPFEGVAVATVLTFCAGGLLLLLPGRPDPTDRVVRRWLVLYALVAVALWAVPNPVGGNVARLGQLTGGPLAVAVLGRRGRRRTAAAVAVPLLVWQVWPVATPLLQAPGDPSARAGYWTGLQAFLRTQDPAAGRVEVPTTRRHWEASYVASVLPLARGWERQADRRWNAVLYRDDLDAAALHGWLRSNGVALVALPDAPVDRWAVRERDLVAAGQPWLVPVWSDRHWRVFRVADAAGLATGPARVTALGVDSVTLQIDRPGDVVVRVRPGPAWQVTAGTACLRAGGGEWLSLHADAPGPVVLRSGWRQLLPALRGVSACGR